MPSLLQKAGSLTTSIARHSDVAMVVLIVVVIALMIIPLPTPLVDTLIGANLTLSFLMLMMAMYVKTPLEFSVFPTMLLFTTLFRVGLNITTTRLILLQADAGEIIFTFGEFATGSNFVVGAVVFLILTIVQFLVIAKGAERVAEVGARFTLDAMPGKQMSIDADLRAGVIDMEEAQRRRDDVQMESKMYGAMDGAMKFVKGDSIAGMVVTLVNIVGGTIIGMTQRGMSAGDALQLYGVLTIGDGLVSQIPSLLVSISAGILITRSGDSREDMGSQVGKQFFRQPRALEMAGALIFLFALIPGFPKPQLFTLGFAVGGFGYMLRRIDENRAAEPAPEAALEKTLAPVGAKAKPRRAVSGEEFSPTVPIILDIAPDIGESINYNDLNGDLIELRRALYFDLGVPFPGIHLRPNPNLHSFAYTLNLNEIPIATGQLVKDCVIVRETPENLALLDIECREEAPFLPNVDSVWVSAKDEKRLTAAGIACMNHSKILAFHLSLLLTRHADSFIGMQETKYLLDKMEERAPRPRARSDASFARSAHRRNLPASRAGARLDPRPAHDSSGAHRMGSEGKGRRDAHGIRPKRLEAPDLLHALEGPEHASRHSDGAAGRGNDPKGRAPDIGRGLPLARSGFFAADSRRPRKGGGQVPHEHPEARFAREHGHPPLRTAPDRVEVLRTSRHGLSGSDA